MIHLLFFSIFAMLCILYFSKRHIGFLFLFSFGVAYYIYAPYLIYCFNFFESYPGMNEWFYSFGQAAEYYEILLYYSFFMILFVIILSNLTNKIKVPHLKTREVHPSVLLGAMIGIFLLLVSVWYQARYMFFKGYSVEYNTTLMGQMATFNLLINFVVMYSYIKKYFKIFYIGLLILSVNSILLLGMGGRMYILTVLISWFLLKMNKNLSSVKSRVKLIYYAAFLTALFSFVGIWRLGIGNIGYLPYILMAEPVFTSYSSATFIANNEIPLLGDIHIYFNSFVGLMPSFFVENKSQFYTLPSDLGYYYLTPLGATSVVVYMLVSFGVIGCPLFLSWLVFLFFILKRMTQNNDIFLVIYYSALSVVPFIFFRETFYISTRVFLMTSAVLPIMILVTNYFFCRAASK
ncbi:O-antigen polymerase [Aeromonas media]|uniref:O-antigen polymerase n=1 Tax=Aeromonas media TaxID=651 RepID=UPI0038D07698